MPRVEFIRLRKPEKAKHLCELAEVFFSEGKRVLITVLDDNQGVTLDRFMWTWRKGSFVPHAYDNGAVDCLEDPIVITTRERNSNGAGVLIMGQPASIPFIRQFPRAIAFAEVYDPARKEAARERYRQYRGAGFALSMRS